MPPCDRIADAVLAAAIADRAAAQPRRREAVDAPPRRPSQRRRATQARRRRPTSPLDEIEPRAGAARAPTPRDAARRARRSTRSSSSPQAREAMLQGQRFTAINLLEQAIKLDPESYRAALLARAGVHVSGGLANEQSIAAYEAAAAIDPDHIIVHSELGRQYLAKGETTKALEHLRLALQTTRVRATTTASPPSSISISPRRCSRPATTRRRWRAYEKLIAPAAGRRAVDARQPGAGVPRRAAGRRCTCRSASCCEKRGRPRRRDRALSSSPSSASRSDFALPGAASCARWRRRGGATRRRSGAADVVRQFRASPDSLALLKEIFQKTGGDDAVVARADAPPPRAARTIARVLYALVDVLTAQGKTREADRSCCADAAQQATLRDGAASAGCSSCTNRADDVDGAARLLIEALAARPDNTRDLTPMWSQLLRPWRRNHLTVSALAGARSLAAGAGVEAVLAVAAGADLEPRGAVAHVARAGGQAGPAVRAGVSRAARRSTGSREDWDDERKNEAATQLIATVERHGDAGARRRAARARCCSTPARPPRRPSSSPRRRKLGGDVGRPAARATRWRCSVAGRRRRAPSRSSGSSPSEQPTCEDAYLAALPRATSTARAGRHARSRCSRRGCSNDPAQRQRAPPRGDASSSRRSRPPRPSERCNDLFAREPDNADVLAALRQLLRPDRADRGVHRQARGAAQRAPGEPRGRRAARACSTPSRSGSPRRRASSTPPAPPPAKDPDLLYYIAGLYTRIGAEGDDRADPRAGRAASTRSTRRRATISATPGPTRARTSTAPKSLIRVAVQTEPDNQSFLDSLGWVLYKRGQFERGAAAARGRRSTPRASPTRSCSITSATRCTAWTSTTRRPRSGSARRSGIGAAAGRTAATTATTCSSFGYNCSRSSSRPKPASR